MRKKIGRRCRISNPAFCSSRIGGKRSPADVAVVLLGAAQKHVMDKEEAAGPAKSSDICKGLGELVVIDDVVQNVEGRDQIEGAAVPLRQRAIGDVLFVETITG